MFLFYDLTKKFILEICITIKSTNICMYYFSFFFFICTKNIKNVLHNLTTKKRKYILQTIRIKRKYDAFI